MPEFGKRGLYKGEKRIVKTGAVSSAILALGAVVELCRADYTSGLLSLASSGLFAVAGIRKFLFPDDENKKTNNHVAVIAGVASVLCAPFFVSYGTNSSQETGDESSTSTTVQIGPPFCEVNIPIAKDDVISEMLVQSGIKELGFDPGPIDGDQGIQTEAALKAFKLFYKYDPETKFNYSMCMLNPHWYDGDKTTPSIPVERP